MYEVLIPEGYMEEVGIWALSRAIAGWLSRISNSARYCLVLGLWLAPANAMQYISGD